MSYLKVGILSGGGDAPGTNAVVRAIVRQGIKRYGDDLLGILDGWRGLLEANFLPLNRENTTGILTRGGSVLGHSRTNPFKHEKGPEKIFKNITKEGLDAIIAIGGDDTLSVAHQLFGLGLKCVGVPKTIDNDLSGTDYTIGFNTAVTIATEALDRLHSTAESHQRVMIIEVMGRHTGWIALQAGLAGGADAILIPEKPFDVSEVVKYIKNRQERGKKFSIIVVAEGTKPKDGEEITYADGVDEFGHARLGGVGYYVGRKIEETINVETRVVVLGHLQRGGSPTVEDRLNGTRFGVAAIDLVHQGKYGFSVALKGNETVAVPLHKVIGKRKTVNEELYDLASIFFG